MRADARDKAANAFRMRVGAGPPGWLKNTVTVTVLSNEQHWHQCIDMKLATNQASSKEKIQEMSGACARGEHGTQLDGNVDAHSCTCSFHFLLPTWSRSLLEQDFGHCSGSPSADLQLSLSLGL